MTNKIPLFLSSDENYAPQMAIAMLSCLTHTDSFIEFYILDAGITDDSKNKILKTLKRYKNFSIEYIFIDMNIFNDFANTESYLNKVTYLRLLIPSIKPNLTCAIYSDVDVLFMGDIVELYNMELDGHVIGAVPDAYYLVNKGANDIYNRLGLSITHNYLNAGLLLIDCQKWREKNMFARVLDIMRTKKEDIVQADQDILNIMFNNNDYKLLDTKWNVMNGYIKCADRFSDLALSIKRPVIRHYESDKKPWTTRRLQKQKMRHFYIWWRVAHRTPFFSRLKIVFETARKSHYFWLFGMPIIKKEKLLIKCQ
ncbi:MAG: glycosyltransferase family 8 protein [Rickettsiales bacterium]|jgi:lipopolysaccharide biosynthesis glycosyltransferase|nr:glycosyltransferase family 8 protein [Rickettsiales bacterium]